MRVNSDKQMGDDFDNHLKLTMHWLSNEVNRNPNSKQVTVIEAKAKLMEILDSKFADYLN